MRFLANENIPRQSIVRLRDSGITVAAVLEDTPGATDRSILRRAADESLVIITFDRDYGSLIYEQQLAPPPGMLYLRFVPRTPVEPAELVLRLINDDKIQLDGKFTVVERERIRQRPLWVDRP